MSLRTIWVEPAELASAVEQRLGETTALLGAYASDEALRYLLLDEHGPLAVSLRRTAQLEIDSLAARLPALDWDEREMRDECGVRFTNHPNARPLRLGGGRVPDALVAEGEGLTRVIVGPIHAGVIEPGRFTISSGGETVVHLDGQFGFAHRGVERALEGRLAIDAAPSVARICGACSASRSLAYAMALEDLAQAELPPEVEIARAVFAELERAYNYLGDLAAAAAGAGWNRGFTQGMRLKERGMRLCAMASGHRLLFDAIVPGGIRGGVLSDREHLSSALHEQHDDVRRFLEELFGNASVRSRWRNAGTLPTHTATAFAASGPAGRASHAGYDVRALAPYGAYRHLAPHRQAAATGGDTLARCSVKRADLETSLALIDELLRRLDEAPLPPAAALPVRTGVAVACVEGPRGAETVAVESDDRGKLARLHVISASFRNWPVVARAMDGNIVPDFPLVNKSFNLCYACMDR